MFMFQRHDFQVLEKNVPGLETGKNFVDLYMSPRGRKEFTIVSIKKKSQSQKRGQDLVSGSSLYKIYSNLRGH